MTYKETLIYFLKRNNKLLKTLFIIFGISMAIACNWESHILYHKYIDSLVIYLFALGSIPIGAWIDYKSQ